MKFTGILNKDVVVKSFYGPRVVNGVKDFHLGVDLGSGMSWNWYLPVRTDGIGMKFRFLENYWKDYDCKQLKRIVKNHYVKFVDISNKDVFEWRLIHTGKCDYAVGQIAISKSYGGKTGNTGCSTGPHTHIELKVNGKYVNPLDYMETYKKGKDTWVRMYKPVVKSAPITDTVPENAPKTNDVPVDEPSVSPDLPKQTEVVTDNNNTKLISTPMEVVKAETYIDRLKNTFSFAGPTAIAAGACGTLLGYYTSLPTEVVTAYTVLIGLAFNVIYDMGRYFIGKKFPSTPLTVNK